MKRIYLLLFFLIFLLGLLYGSKQLRGRSLKRFSVPQYLATDSRDNVYIIDRLTNKKRDHIQSDWHLKDILFKVTPDGQLIYQVNLRSFMVYDIAISKKQAVFLLAGYSSKRRQRFIMKISPSGLQRKIVIKNLRGHRTPTGIAVDHKDNLYLLSNTSLKAGIIRYSNQVIKYSPQGQKVYSWKLNNNVVFAGRTFYKFINSSKSYDKILVLENLNSRANIEILFTDSLKRKLIKNLPEGKSLVVDAKNNIYLASAKLEKFNEESKRLKLFAKIAEPAFVAVSNRFIYATIYRNHNTLGKVYKFTLDGKLVDVWKGVYY